MTSLGMSLELLGVLEEKFPPANDGNEDGSCSRRRASIETASRRAGTPGPPRSKAPSEARTGAPDRSVPTTVRAAPRTRDRTSADNVRRGQDRGGRARAVDNPVELLEALVTRGRSAVAPEELREQPRIPERPAREQYGGGPGALE